MNSVILLHGALGSAENLRKASDLISEDYHVFTCDFPGHGNNNNEEFGMNAFVDSVKELIRKNNIETYSIFGYSMGGFVALKFASEKPAGLQKIVTLGTKFDWTQESAAKEVKMLSPQVIEEKVPKFAAYLNGLHSDWKSLMNKTAGMMLQLGEENGLSEELLSELEVPVKLYRGSEDNMVSSEETMKVLTFLPNAFFELLEGIQHPIDKIDPQLIARLIRRDL